MAISFVGSAVNSSSPNTGTSVDVSGTGIQANDLILVAAAVGDTANNGLAAPTQGGYARVPGVAATLYANDVNDTNLDLYYKVADGTETAVSFAAVGGTNASNAAVVMVFRGVDTTTPFDTNATTATGISTSNADPPSHDWSGAAGVWTVIAASTGHTGGATASFTFPANYTTNAAQRAHNDTIDVLVGMGYRTNPADPENPGAFTAATIGTAADNAWAAVTMSLNPATGPVANVGTDTTTVTESALGMADAQPTESVTVTEAASGAATASATDSLAITESAVAGEELSLVGVDSFTVTEFAVSEQVFDFTGSDSFTVSEAGSAEEVLGLTATETLTVSEDAAQAEGPAGPPLAVYADTTIRQFIQAGTLTRVEYTVDRVRTDAGAILDSTGMTVSVYRDNTTEYLIGTYPLDPETTTEYSTGGKYRGVARPGDGEEMRGLAIFRLTTPSTWTKRRSCPLYE